VYRSFNRLLVTPQNFNLFTATMTSYSNPKNAKIRLSNRMKLLSVFVALAAAVGDLKAAIGKPAPAFTAEAVVDGDFQQVSLSDYKGKYLVFFFYPLDFTFVCPTEIIAFRSLTSLP